MSDPNSKSSDILSDGPVKDILKPGDKQVGLYSGGGGAYIWNEVSVSTCGGLIHWGGAYSI